MPNKEECNFCPFDDSPFDHLVQRFALLSFAIEGAAQIMQAEYSNLPTNYSWGLSIAWTEFKQALERYMNSYDDDYSFLAGGE